MSRTVTLYGLSTCVQCRSARNLLLDHQIPFEFIEVDLLEKEEKQKAVEALKKIQEKTVFPTLIAGETVVTGFKKKEILQFISDYQNQMLNAD